MHIDQAFPSKYLTAPSLDGKEKLFVISSAEIESLGDDRKLVVYFQNHDKGLVCNRTNALTISEFCGPDTDGWVGKEVVLFPTKVPFQGKLVDAIRIRAPRRPQNTKVMPKKPVEPEPDMDDAIPF